MLSIAVGSVHDNGSPPNQLLYNYHCNTAQHAIAAMDGIAPHVKFVFSLSFFFHRSTPAVNARLTTLLVSGVKECRIHLNDDCTDVCAADVRAWSNAGPKMTLVLPFRLEHALMAGGMSDNLNHTIVLRSANARDPLGRILRALGAVALTTVQVELPTLIAELQIDALVQHSIAKLEVDISYAADVVDATKIVRFLPATEIRKGLAIPRLYRVAAFDMACQFARHIHRTKVRILNGGEDFTDWIEPFAAFAWGAALKSSVATPVGYFRSRDGDNKLGFRVRSFLEPAFYRS